MRYSSTVVRHIWLAGFAMAAGVTIVAQQPFRSATTTVSVFATVSDGESRLAPNLSAGDFRILDNGKAAEITVFSSEIQTITTTLLLDMSGSMVPRLLWTRDAAEAAVDELIGADRARIGTFGTEIAINPNLTADKSLLKRILHEELWPGGGTPLWHGIDAAMTSMKDEPGRRIVLVITDGNDSTSGRIDDGDIRNRAIREDFMVYAIAINGHELNSDLRRVAAQSGGGYVIVNDHDDLKTTLRDVINELRHQYVLGFTPAVHDGKMHKLTVQLAQKNLKARVRSEYLAPGK